jgi:diketogulonate reductase-like aldo/keto reductase
MDQPMITFYNGIKMPTLLFGTWKIPKELAAESVKQAVKVGYRGIDCAAIYGNEKEVGKGLKELFDSGIKRTDLFITSKLWNTCHSKEHVKGALDQTLRDLQLDYLDLYMIHWPVSFQFTGYDLKPEIPRDKNGEISFGNASLQETWKAMEDLLSTGKVRSIGVSNYPIICMLDLFTYAKIKPVINQIEIHPYNTRYELVEFLKSRNINPMAYSSLGSGKEGPLSDPFINELSKKYHKTPAQILIRWSMQRGHSVIAKSNHPDRIVENFQVLDFEISQEDIAKINKLDRKQVVCDTREYWSFPMDV